VNLQLLYHPLASFCWKVQIALYEIGTPFEALLLDLGDPRDSEELRSLWPLRKFPVLRDRERDQVVPETSIIIEYLDRHYAGTRPMIPRDPELALQERLWDRLFDFYVQLPMQKIVGDGMRPEGHRDAVGVSEARSMLHTLYCMLEKDLGASGWVGGSDFGMADCAAAPALFYAGTLESFEERYPRVAAYFDRLSDRPSVVRTIKEAQPYFHMYPGSAAIPARFLSATAVSFSRTAGAGF